MQIYEWDFRFTPFAVSPLGSPFFCGTLFFLYRGGPLGLAFLSHFLSLIWQLWAPLAACLGPLAVL